MGSKLGKSTLVPTRIANTCGVKVLSFWTIRATTPAGAGAGDPATGSSHTTTPEKSMCLRTAASCESRSSTRPDTAPATRFDAAARLSSNTNRKPLDDSRGSESGSCQHRPLQSRDSNGAESDIRLKKVCKCQVIMRIDHCARSQIGGAYLRGFKTCQYIRAQAVHDVRAIALVLSHTAEDQIAVAVVFLAAVNMECSPPRGPERK